MLDIKKIDHLGIRVRDRHRSVAFYEEFGFKVIAEGIFEKGHPVIMQHPCGIVLNILGPANQPDGPNILMDVPEKYAGYTHMSLAVSSLAATEAFLKERDIKITGRINFKDLNALFVRDPDGNVIEFDDYPEEQPQTRQNPISHGHD